jgi:hypothetical protein
MRIPAEGDGLVEWSFSDEWRAAKLPEMREGLRALKKQRRPAPLSLLLLTATDGASDAELPARFVEAIGALADLDSSHRRGGGMHRRKIAGVATRARIVAALQAIVVGDAARLPFDWLAALVAEGSEDSADALLPRIDRAFKDGGVAVEELAELRSFASSNVMLGLCDEIAARHARQLAESPARVLAERMGVAQARWRLHFASVEMTDSFARVSGTLRIDSGQATWFELHLSSGGKNTLFERTPALVVRCDDLGVGACEPDELPEFLARLAKRMDVHFHATGSELEPDDQKRVVRWLFP